MTTDPESSLFDFAASNQIPTNEEERTVTEVYAALGMSGVPLRLRRPPKPAPPPRWRGYLHSALAAALVLAVATAGFFAIQQQTTTPSPTEIPEVVLGLAQSPEAEAMSTVALESCDFTGDVPIFSGIQASPIDGPAVLVSLERQLKLVCNGEVTALAEGVTMAIPTQTPHVLLAMTDAGPLLVNIASEESLLIEPGHDNVEWLSIPGQAWGSWMILPSSDDASLSSLYNLISLTEHPIESSTGRIALGSITNAPSGLSASGDTFVLSVPLERETDSPSRAGFVIAESDGTTRFVETGEDPAPRQIAVSPNGETIAASSYQGEPGGGTTTVTIYSVADGTTLDSWEHETRDTFFDLTWLDDGSALLFSDGSTLYKVTEPGAEHEIVFEGERLQGLTLTNDEQVVTIWHVTNSEPGQGDFETAIINVETGEAISVPGRDIWAGPPFTAKRTTLLLAEDVASTPGQTQTLTAVDAATGEPIGEFEYTVPDHRGFSQSSWGNDRGDIEVVAYSPDSMWRLVDDHGNPTLERIPAPPIEPSAEEEAVSIMISPEGFLSLRIFEPTRSWIMLPGDNEWIEIGIVAVEDSPGIHPSVSFVIGADTATDTPPEKSTPVASPGSAATCDFTGDMPLVMGASSAQFDGANVIVTPSGELKLVCGDSATTLATNVDFAFLMNTPGVVLAETADGAMLLNIETAGSLQLPVDAMTILQNQGLISSWGSWMVAPSIDDQNMASLYDLRTLTEIPITQGSGHRVSKNAVVGLSVNTTDTHAAIAVSFQYSQSSHYLQGFFIAEADGKSRFIDTQQDVLPREIAISPDGEIIATSWYQGTMERGESNISLYDAATGKTIESWTMQTRDIQTELTWLSDGSGLVLTDGSALYRLDAQHPGDGFQVLLEGPEVGRILLTPDPQTVVVGMTEQQEQGPPSSQTAIVDTVTGESLLLDGRDLWASSFGQSPTRSVLVLVDFFSMHSQESLTLKVVDSVTGEVIGEIEHDPPGQVSLSNASSQRNHGDVDIFSLTADSTWQLLDENDQPALRQIPPPDGRSGDVGSDLLVSMGPDGQVVMTFFDPFEVWLWTPDGDSGEWRLLDVAPPDNELGLPIVVLFIPGSD